MPKKTKPGLLEFVKNLLSMREALGVSQKQLGDILDTDDRQISRYETGQVEMGAMLYDRFQQVLSSNQDPQTETLLRQWSMLSAGYKQQLLNLAITFNKAQNAK